MVRSIDREHLIDLMAGPDLQLIEVLPAEEFSEAHLPGAINVPLKELDGESVAHLRRSAPTVVY